MPTPSTQRQRAPSPQYVPIIPPLRPQLSFPHPPHYDRPMSTDNYTCTDPSTRRRPRATAHEIYPLRSSPAQASQLPVRHTANPPRGPQPSSSLGERNHFTPTHGLIQRASGPNFRFHQFTNPLGIDTVHGVHVPEQISYTSKPPNTPSSPQPVPALLDNWKMNLSKKVGIKTFH